MISYIALRHIVWFALPLIYSITASPPMPTNNNMIPLTFRLVAASCRPGLPVVAAAPAVPCESPVAVTGAFTTTTEVRVCTSPLGSVVTKTFSDVEREKDTSTAEERNVTRPPPMVL